VVACLHFYINFNYRVRVNYESGTNVQIDMSSRELKLLIQTLHSLDLGHNYFVPVVHKKQSGCCTIL